MIDDKTSESDLDAMQKAGFRGIRLNLATGALVFRRAVRDLRPALAQGAD